jgi:hypothetical protein
VLDFRRALEEKRSKVEAMRAKGYRTMLLLDAAENPSALGMREAFGRAMTPELALVYDEVLLSASAWVPPDPVEFAMLKGEPRPALHDPKRDVWQASREAIRGRALGALSRRSSLVALTLVVGAPRASIAHGVQRAGADTPGMMGRL